MPTITEQYRSEAEARVNELRPSVDEYHELIEFLDLTSKIGTSNSTSSTSKSKTKTRSRKRTATVTSGKRRGRKPVRALEFENLIKSNPGLTIREASKQIEGVNETYLHRIGKDLIQSGTLRKEGSHYFPAATTTIVVDSAPVITNEAVETETPETPEVQVDPFVFDRAAPDDAF
jgi:hypothetical protein